jgi:hypothetical protein
MHSTHPERESSLRRDKNSWPSRLLPGIEKDRGRRGLSRADGSAKNIAAVR